MFETGATVDGILRTSGAPQAGGDEVALETSVQTMLGRVGFSDAAQTVETLSGGWKKRPQRDRQ